MQLKRITKYQSSINIINRFESHKLDWSLNAQHDNRLIITCNSCAYPISFEEFILDEIRDENNISFGIIIPIEKLFEKVKILKEDPFDQWRTEVLCPNCGKILSFVNPRKNKITVSNFTEVTEYRKFDEPIVILWTFPLYRGSAWHA